VNVSSTEGIPVSIMEAISCGIPVVATKVGGNPEIVQEQNGLLLSPNPTPNEIARIFLHICDTPGFTDKMRRESRRIWRERFNAEKNFSAFSEKLKDIYLKGE